LNTEPSSQLQRELYVPHPSLTRLLRNFLGNGSAMFKTPEQAEAIEFVLAHEHHLLLVGPTAMGKTLAYMLPAANRDHRITCVLLPLSALHTDFDRRCTDLKIESSRWTPQNDRPRTKIIYVSPEHAQTKRFNDHVFELHRLGLLKQFVIDEVHLVKSHSDFRFCFSALKPLLSCGESENQRCTVKSKFSYRRPLLVDDSNLSASPSIRDLGRFRNQRLPHHPRPHRRA
jgi:superfamily II DNA helicase RecQ